MVTAVTNPSLRAAGRAAVTGAIFLVFAGVSAAETPSSVSPPPERGANTPVQQTGCSKFIPVGSKPSPLDYLPLVRVTITAQGEIRDAQLVRSTGDNHVDEAVLACANGYRFTPLTVNGTAVDARWVLAFKMSSSISGFTPARLDTGICNNRLGPSVARRPLHDIKITYRIGKDGAPTGLVVAQSSGNEELDGVTADCIAAARYFPVTAPDGQPIEPDREFIVKLNIGPPRA